MRDRTIVQPSSRLEWGTAFPALLPTERHRLERAGLASLPPAASGSALRLKRWIDVAGGAVGLLALFPLLALAALAIKLESPGPVLFRQYRVGRWLRPFRIFKLRSMYFNPRDRGARWTMKGDQRVTRVGRFLRRTRLDEVPQLWNVLKGEMSLIGPRPEQVPLARRLAQLTPDYDCRHAVRPGITGWAQINMGYCAGTEESQRKLEYDLFYLRHISLRLDLKVALGTVSVVLTGKGSR